MREVLRKNKGALIDQLQAQNKKLVFSLTYVSDERPSYQLLEQKLCKALDLLIKEMNLWNWYKYLSFYCAFCAVYLLAMPKQTHLKRWRV